MAWFAVPHMGCPPNGGLMRVILDESHQKGRDYVSYQSVLLIIQRLMLSLNRLFHFKFVLFAYMGKREGRREEAEGEREGERERGREGGREGGRNTWMDGQVGDRR